MNRVLLVVVLLVLASVIWLVVRWNNEDQGEEKAHSLRAETQLFISYPSNLALRLFKAGNNLDEISEAGFLGNEIWLQPGNYYLEAAFGSQKVFYAAPMRGYQSGPDANGSFLITVRESGDSRPPRLVDSLSDFVLIPGGTFLLGDRLNPREQHYVWLTSYFIGRFELTNGEFREFLAAVDGYANDANWTEAGWAWKSINKSQTTATLNMKHPDYRRFGRTDQPVTWINWFEANAYCRWLTTRLGRKKWLFSLPNEAEWEKAARGPDNFDYGLGMTIGDVETPRYNWKKNPDATVTVEGNNESASQFRPNRYGLYHVSGNVTEWTQSINRQYSSVQPYRDDERNHDDVAGLRVARGGSWYSASTANLYIPYRDAFQPEHSTQEVGFRVVAKMLP
ncbi:MAG TPA: SUMF1/EgtB/PvdO family nonheme iron enzyme [Bacteroidota bacterium]|nr:SUMF1/EgtB/PvdO family nonheme iron enzyme [Bacteroidota bacterium]